MATKRPSLVSNGSGSLRNLFGRNGSLRQILNDRKQVKAKLLGDGSDESDTEPYDFGTAIPSKEDDFCKVKCDSGTLKDSTSFGTQTAPNEEPGKTGLRRPSFDAVDAIKSPVGRNSSDQSNFSPSSKSPASESADDPIVRSKVAEAAAAMSSVGDAHEDRDSSLRGHRRSFRSSHRGVSRSRSDEGPSSLNMDVTELKRSISEDLSNSALVSSAKKYSRGVDKNRDRFLDEINSSTPRRRGVRRAKSSDIDMPVSSSRSSRLDSSTHSGSSSPRSTRGLRRTKSVDSDESLTSMSRSSSRAENLESDAENSRRLRSSRSHRNGIENDADRSVSNKSTRSIRSSRSGLSDQRDSRRRRSFHRKRSNSAGRSRLKERLKPSKESEEASRERSESRRRRRHKSRSSKPKSNRSPTSTVKKQDDIDTGTESDFSQSSHSSCVQFDVCDGSVRDFAVDGGGSRMLGDDDGSLTSNSDWNDSSTLLQQGSVTLYDTPWMAG